MALSTIGTTSTYPTYANQTGYWNATTTLTNNSAPSTTSYVSGSAAIWSCGVAWGDYMSAEGDAIDLEAGLSPVLGTWSWTTNITVYDIYTLCDGIPRVIVSGSTMTTTYLTTALVLDNLTIASTTEEFTSIVEPTPVVITVTQTVTTIIAESFVLVSPTPTSFIPSPTCNIAPTDCAWLVSESSNALWTGGSLNLSAVPSVWCTYVQTVPLSSCMLSVPAVQLI